MKKLIVIAVIFVALVASGTAWWYRSVKAAENDAAAAGAAQTAKVTRQDLRITVDATGAVSSNQDVDIKCQASGTVKTLPYTDVSAHVPPGALLLQVDTKDEQPAVDLAAAEVEADKAKLHEAGIDIDIAKMSLVTTQQKDESDLASAKASLNDAQNKARRTKELFEQKLAAQEDLETANTTAATAEAAYAAAQVAIAELPQLQATIETKKDEYDQMQQQLAQDVSRLATAKQNLAYCTVDAPIANDPKDPPDWYISAIETNFAVGYLVQSGSSGFSGGTTVMTLSDMSHVFVLATVDESDIGTLLEEFTAGQELPVILTADAYRNVQFRGKVVRIATKGVNTSNVVTFEVKIEVTSPNRTLLRPIMTTNVQIITGQRDNCLVVPVQAVTLAHNDVDDLLDEYSGSTTEASAPAADSTGAATKPAKKKKHHAAADDTTLPNLGPQAATVEVENADGTTETRDVTLGLTDDTVYEVVSGLKEGDTVLLKKFGADSRWRGAAKTNSRSMMHGIR